MPGRKPPPAPGPPGGGMGPWGVSVMRVAEDSGKRMSPLDLTFDQDDVAELVERGVTPRQLGELQNVLYLLSVELAPDPPKAEVLARLRAATPPLQFVAGLTALWADRTMIGHAARASLFYSQHRRGTGGDPTKSDGDLLATLQNIYRLQEELLAAIALQSELDQARRRASYMVPYWIDLALRRGAGLAGDDPASRAIMGPLPDLPPGYGFAPSNHESIHAKGAFRRVVEICLRAADANKIERSAERSIKAYLRRLRRQRAM